MTASDRPKRSRRLLPLLSFFIVVLLVLFLLWHLFWPKTRAYLHAAAILGQLNGEPAPRLLRPIAAMPLTARTLTIPSAAGPVIARLYTPVSHPNAPAMMIVPGVNYLGIDEPRLMAFAHSIAACGLRVLTVELPDSRDYRIKPSDVQAVGDATQWLRHTTGRRVGLMGLSFSGGLVLMAAAEPQYSKNVSFVFSVGAHDNLYRVATFYATGADPLPDGNVERAVPNNYGPWILEYEHLEDFTQPQDTAAIRAAFRARLTENYSLEKTLVAAMTSTQKAEYERILNITSRDPSLLFASNKKHAAEMAAVSPHGHLAGLHVPVYLLHGRDDTIIPFAEAEWLVQDLPHGTLKESLISPLIAHVSTTKGKPGIWNEWKLLHLLAQVMERAEHA